MFKKITILPIIILMLTTSTIFATEEIGKKDSELTGLGSGIWKTNKIPVCWENPKAENNKERIWVRDAVKNTWEKHSLVRFINWNNCKSNSRGIRVKIEDSGPHVKKLGSHLDGMKNGMVLNFTFSNWSLSCKNDKEFCIKVIAVHEFGHALSFAHEQNRPDAPNECKKESQGTTGDILITPYDLKSVMNYCNPQWGGNGQLSQYDIQGLHVWYKNPINLLKYLSGGKGSWINLNKTKATLNNIRFGDFNGDGKTDILTKRTSELVSYLSGGKGSWINLNKTKATLNNMRFGDFNGDGKTDILTKRSSEQVSYLSGGKGSWIDLNKTKATLNNMHFGDFNGDGKTDILTKRSSELVSYLSGGKGSWIDLNKTKATLNNMRFGDFNGDGKTDILTKRSSEQVSYLSGGKGSWIDLNKTKTALKKMLFSDIDGDNKTDIIYLFNSN